MKISLVSSCVRLAKLGAVARRSARPPQAGSLPHRLCWATVLIAAFLTVGLTRTVSAADDMAAALSRMDKAASTFRGMTANTVMVQYTKLLDDKTTQRGAIQMQRPKTSDIRAILDFPGEQTVAFSGKTVTLYYPKINAYQTYPASKLVGNTLNQFLLLGFGSSGQELKQNYTITADGNEKVGGKQATKLMLVPKEAKVAERLPKAELWIPEDAGYPIQQKFWDSTAGNYRLLTYSDVKINPPMTGNLEFKPPAGAQKQK